MVEALSEDLPTNIFLVLARLAAIVVVVVGGGGSEVDAVVVLVAVFAKCRFICT